MKITIATLVILATLVLPATADTKIPDSKAQTEEARIYQLSHARAADIESILRCLLTPIAGKINSTENTTQAKEAIFDKQVGLASDPRLNLLIVVSQPKYFHLFDTLVSTLDKPTEERTSAPDNTIGNK